MENNAPYQFRTNERKLVEFANLISKMEVTEFIGLAKALGVHVFNNDVKDEQGHPMPREAEEIVVDCILAFDNCNRDYRKQILRIVRKAVK